MFSIAPITNTIPTMSDAAIDKVRQFESQALSMPQIDIPTSHVIHAGMYARTIMIPAGTILTGALIKIATILIINGNVIAYIGSETIEFTGYNVLPASENRKQAFLAKTDTYLTMIFPTDVDNINDAEEQFTDEADMLISRKTGE